MRLIAMPSPDEADLREFAKYEALAEKAYAEMYDSRTPAACYSDLKDYFASAIAAAHRAGLGGEAKRLEEKLKHCKKVYRSQFAGF
jgi:hypothetical protein